MGGTVELLQDDDIEARIAKFSGAVEAGEGTATASLEPLPRERKYIKPLTAISDSLIEALRIPEGIGLGLTEIDVFTRGFRPQDLVIVTGFAHSGKTQLTNTMIVNNPDKKILFFSLDDPAEMILAKLVAMQTDVPASLLEDRIRDGDEDAASLIREVAEKKFPNLLVVDDVLDIKSMKIALDEATEVFGASPDCIIVDYLEMIPGALEGEGENIKKTANKLKRWAKKLDCPLVVLHQGTRSNAKLGEPITLLSMGHSGEQQATIVIGCRRQKDNEKLDQDDRLRHLDTITVHVVKNKRPGARCTQPEGIDFHMKWQTGLISPLERSEQRQVQGSPPSAADVKRSGGIDFEDREMF